MVSIYLTLLCFIDIVFAENVFLNISDGQIMGKDDYTTLTKRKFYSFTKIPYAAAPLGKLRFQPPQKAIPWSGVYNATQPVSFCWQVAPTFSGRETEDCLFINVFTPTLPPFTKLLPVYVFIHGGAFMIGSSSPFGAHYILEFDMVVVTFNYRLGPFGFFTTGDDEMRGNAGLYDQVMALRWVQKNIANFGGDPLKVTIGGESAGGASVGYHLICPLSAGLFSAAHMSSGAPISPWAYQINMVDITYKTAAIANPVCNISNNSTAFRTCIESVSAEQIAAAAYTYFSSDTLYFYQFLNGFFYAPHIESSSDGFLTKSMYETLLNGPLNSVPLLITSNSEERIGVVYNMNTLSTQLMQFDLDPSLMVPDDMGINDTATKRAAGTEIKSFYTSGQIQNNITGAVKFFTDSSFIRANRKFAEMYSKYNSTYYIQMSYEGVLGNDNATYPGCETVDHYEEIPYEWRTNSNIDLSTYPSSDLMNQKRMLTALFNFVTYHNPTPFQEDILENLIIPPVTPTGFLYLNLNRSLHIMENLHENTYPLWVALYKKYVQTKLYTF